MTQASSRRIDVQDGPAHSGWVVILLTIAGAALRAISVDSRGLWLDEAITVKQASEPLYSVIRTLAFGVHPPLYHIIVHFWMQLFGRSEIAVRSFSVLVGVAAIPVAYWAGHRLYDRRTGLIAAGLIALSPFQIWYSQEARMYELLFLAGMASTAFLALALRENRRPLWTGYLLTTLVGVFTHYFFLFLLLGQVGFYLFAVLIREEKQARREGVATASLKRPWKLSRDVPTFGPWFVCASITLVVLGVWAANSVFVQPTGGPNALVSSVGGAGLGYGQEGARLALRFNDTAMVVAQMVAGFHSLPVMEVLVAIWPLLLYLGLLLAYLVKPVAKRTWLLLAGGVFAAAVMILLGQWQGQILVSRYFMAVAGPLFLLAARILSKLERRVAVPVITALALLAVPAWADQSFNPANAMRYDNRAAFSIIRQDWRVGDQMVYVPFYLDPLVTYYLPATTPSFGFPQEGQFGKVRDSLGEIDEDLQKAVGLSGRAWVVLSFQNIPRLRTDGQAVRYWFKHHGYHVVLDRRMNQVELLLYESGQKEKFFLPPAIGGRTR